jgi:glycosyltransferase involved in cell wall biosynthesis
MIEALEENFQLSVFCGGGESNGVAINVVPRSKRAAFIGRIPILRRLRDWQTWYSNVDHDRFVARALAPADVFQGATGQCLDSFQAARTFKARTVLDVVTLHIDYFGQQLDQECADFGIRPTLSRSMRHRILEEYRQADLIRVMSQVAKRTFLERGFKEERIVVATPPFPLDEFPEADFNQPVFRACFVGLIEPWKGFHYLIQAFNAADLPDSELVLWGGPGSRSVSSYLREQTARNPRIVVRPVEIRQVGYAGVYGTSSVLVHPSLSDGFAYVVGEAMACGIPVIVTSCSGAADLVQDGVNGYVIPPRDVSAIRDRLVQLAKDPGLVRKLGAAARQTIQSLTAERFRAALSGRIMELLG